ncbi:MAG: UvrD-helicase domain-containing protein, partial [Clostridia bacterium]|nr:UvrD-helicase domain-containing protein [Clostridia bacterium]
ARLGETGNDVWAATFHSTCARMLRRDADKIGYNPRFTIYDTDDSHRLIKDVQSALSIDDKLFPYRMILSEISRAKEAMLSPDEYRKKVGADYRLRKVAEAYEMYQRRLKEADAMDFDDLLCNTIELLRRCPDVLEYYQNRFRYILVDEYQDTNHAQYIFTRLLAGDRKNICVVGDDDQSIYKFRGATIENILSFEKSYPNAEIIRLEQNYRSTQNILDAANAVIKNNDNRKGKNLWTENKNGDKVLSFTAASEQDEAQFISDTVTANVASGMKFSDHAVLYRLNAQSNSIESMFVRAGIPYRIIGGHRFYERKEIRDMIAYLSLLNNTNDDIRLRRIINEPKRGIGNKTVSTAAEISQVVGISLFEVFSSADQFEHLSRAAKPLKAFCDMINGFLEMIDSGCTLHALYEEILDKTGYIGYLKAQNDKSDERIENINELASNIVKFEEENGENATLSAFLEEVSLMTDIDNYNADSDAVTLMTIHSAKGLEFPAVFLPGMEEGIFPGMQSLNSEEEIEEERRLAYVAITRAKKKLYIITAKQRMMYGSTKRNIPSRFVREIPDELLENKKSDSIYDYGSSYGTSQNTGGYGYTSQFTQKSAYKPASVYTKPPKNTTVYNVGDSVTHPTFGKGMILSASAMGNDTLLEVAFEKVGTKKLMANFAKLKKI